MTLYYGFKSPKAKEARQRVNLETQSLQETPTQETEDRSNMGHIINRGLTALFWEINGGSADHPTADTMAHPPSVAMVGSTVESGRPTRREQSKEEDPLSPRETGSKS